MKRLLYSTFAALVLASVQAHAGGPTISLSINGQIAPGVYGQIDLGNLPPPPLLLPKPTIISPPAARVEAEPIYLHVPPGHAKNWAKYCRRYHACDKPVYFVRSEEYDRYDREHGGGHWGEHDRGEGHRDRGDHWDRGRGNEGRDEGRRGRGRDRDD